MSRDDILTWKGQFQGVGRIKTLNSFRKTTIFKKSSLRGIFLANQVDIMPTIKMVAITTWLRVHIELVALQ